MYYPCSSYCTADLLLCFRLCMLLLFLCNSSHIFPIYIIHNGNCFIFSSATYYFGIDTSIEGSVSPEKVGRITVRKSLRALPDESKFTLLVVATDSAPQDEQLTTTCTAVITVSKGVIDPKPRWDPRLDSKVYVPEVRIGNFLYCG